MVGEEELEGRTPGLGWFESMVIERRRDGCLGHLEKRNVQRLEKLVYGDPEKRVTVRCVKMPDGLRDTQMDE